ncbi:response regulator [Marinobacter zhanjiangensis]|uniref:Response regulator n=1 Tax=Marinobacter zhanjiangensis TaxID=578215 RepID=A0ABQ3AME4_9GAMM|nr:response regulator [Marinobacter zhanjiangensis]GGY59896.1 response regulator [Marinobacter zhanjiangensis]
MSHTLPMRIFIADDDADDRLLIRDAFLESDASLRLTFFESGDAIVDGLADARARRALPQLILLDLNMPGKNGRDIIAELKADPALRGIPIVVLTTSRDENDIAACYDLGASSYVVKPVSYEELLEITRSLTHYWSRTTVLPGQSKYYV